MFSLSVSINFNKRFFESNQIKNAKIVEYLNDSLNYLNNFVNRNEIKRLKILTHKQCC